MVRELLGAGPTASGDCRCVPSFDGAVLDADAEPCPASGDLAESPGCRATVIEALGGDDASAVRMVSDGQAREYIHGAVALLVAASRFARRVEPIDQRLAERTRREPLAAATEAVGRSGSVADIAARTGLAECGADEACYDSVLACYRRPTLADARIRTSPPAGGVLQHRRTTARDCVVRLYETPSPRRDEYHVEPREHRFDPATLAALDGAYDRVARAVGSGAVGPHEAAMDVCPDGRKAAAVGTVLEKHTTGLGVLTDIFADERVSDVYVTAPVARNELRVRVDGETRRTNVRLTQDGAHALASTFRRTSGRALSQASPTLDAAVDIGDREVRIAGVDRPVSDGLAFAFRARDDDEWRLHDLVENGTLPPDTAGLLSVAVERGSACLVAGPRGAGKTTTLGALLWELPRALRTLVIEDTPELPVDDLQDDGRDVQALRTAATEGPSISSTEALRTALRLGEGALVVGEVRGAEASVLYEAMRVGGGDGAVLGTIHGNGPEAVRERLVADLGVSLPSFAATDLVVTLAAPSSDGGRSVTRVDEVLQTDTGVRFEALYERTDSTAASAGRIERGTSHLVESLSSPGESYEALRTSIAERAEEFEQYRDALEGQSG